MNEFEQQFVRFLLTADKETLKTWYLQASDNDILEAAALMDRFAAFLEDELLTLNIENQIATMPVLFEAQAVIASIRDL